MHLGMYNEFLKGHFNLVVNERDKDFVKEGKLLSLGSDLEVPIKNYIPRFCEDGYTESFGMQWHKFKNLQVDSKSGHSISYDRITKCTKWQLIDLKGKRILECGCGPGRFTEIFLSAGAKVVAVDMSCAVDVNLENNDKKDNFLLLQCDINNMPFFHGKFDYVYCYGVLQHTPNPEETFNNLTKYLAKGGRISIDIYRKLLIPTGWTTPKYLWRPITKRMKKEVLLKIIEWYIPKYIDFDTIFRSIPKKIGDVITGFIPVPCWNYVNRGYSKEERIRHAIMDTFDALSPAYDFPQTKKTVKKWFSKCSNLTDIDIFYGANGVVGNAVKR